ncbi:hypothetical protein [Deinococcus daejeonensis]|uniref:Uncharacterized protein n=1 Tax=Deinococcus daejeonensis TaxID=1007098 RepID=A0ABQ2IZD9_9DEIO|nr:hypothetical protein [Deinococcus daejeonensis]GGN32297.1 hypothetical protein GCM10010842_08860 [Deinococcus daejeonensis]
MGKYRVKYASHGGQLTGKLPGDEVEVRGDEEKQLLDLGLIESEEDYQQRQEAKAQAEAEAQQVGSELDMVTLSSIVSTERVAELIEEEEDRVLEKHATKGNGGWYEFTAAGKDGKPVKVQGRDKAIEHLAGLLGEGDRP